MFTVQGRLETHDRFTSKKNEEMQTICLYCKIAGYQGKMKPLLVQLFIPVSIQGLEKYIDKLIMVPVSPSEKEPGKFNHAEDGRGILVQNDKGEFVSLAKRPESLKPASQKSA